MSILAQGTKAVSAWHKEGRIYVRLADGRELNFPISTMPLLRGATHKQLGNIEISPYGLHWPELDEDLSVQGILEGRYGG